MIKCLGLTIFIFLATIRAYSGCYLNDYGSEKVHASIFEFIYPKIKKELSKKQILIKEDANTISGEFNYITDFASYSYTALFETTNGNKLRVQGILARLVSEYDNEGKEVACRIEIGGSSVARIGARTYFTINNAATYVIVVDKIMLKRWTTAAKL